MERVEREVEIDKILYFHKMYVCMCVCICVFTFMYAWLFSVYKCIFADLFFFYVKHFELLLYEMMLYK